MHPALFAAIAACCFAGSHVVSKRGTQTTSVVAGLLVSLISAVSVLLVATLIDPPSEAPVGALALLAASGLFAPAIGRVSNIAGIHRLGASVSVSIQAGIYPVSAVSGAALFLGETPGLARILGTVAIVAGIFTLSREAPRDLGEDEAASRARRARRAALVFPLVAGLAYGASDLVRKASVELLPHPVFAALVAVSTALLVWGVGALTLPQVRRRITVGPGAWWFVLGGVLAATAIVALFRALREGEVSLVSPIVAAQPLVILLLSTVVLRGIERLNRRIVLGSLTTVVGLILVAR